MRERDFSFDHIVAAINNGGLLDVVVHPNRKKYPDQKIYLVAMEGYIYLVPFVEMENGDIFLKTAFPSRKATKTYQGRN
jgi:hypothetical protein